MRKYSEAERDAALAQLRDELKPGDVVYCILRHVSQSGMTRWISPVIISRRESDGTPYVRDLSYLAARALGWSLQTHGNEGIEVGGAGMDMGFHLVYSLSRALWPDGYLGEDDEVHRDGGYALNHRWL